LLRLVRPAGSVLIPYFGELELGASETARRLGLKVCTVTKWASRYKWSKDALPGVARARVLGKRGDTSLTVADVSQQAANRAVAGTVASVSPSEALKNIHQECSERTRTALARVTVAAAEEAAAQLPPPVLSTSHLSEMMARLSFNTACELGFRGSLDEWKRLMGAVAKR